MNISKIAKHFVIPLLLCLFSGMLSISVLSASSNSKLLSDEVISKEIVYATSLVEGRYTPVVKKYLHNHIFRYPNATEVLLGKKSLYFPIFEKVLRENGLPEDLKYLPIIESGLNPNARSYVGATGLWQFMPGTAEMQGLKVNRHVDERKNPIKATEAAVDHLKKLFNIYGDWALVLAAYNSGPGNVNKAIRRAGSRDFWEIRNFLPRETRGYVPIYVAVNYLFKNHLRYNLNPQLPELDLQITGRITVHDHLSFEDIASWTELSLELIRTLNPGFKRDYVPGSFNGYTLILPRRVIEVVRQRMSNLEENAQCEIISPLAGSYQKLIFEGSAGAKVVDIADYFNINPHNIYDWNGFHIGEVLEGDMPISLYIYQPKEGLVLMNRSYPRTHYKILPIPTLSLHPADHDFGVAVPDRIITPGPMIGSSTVDRKRIKLHKGQHIQQIILNIPEMTLEKLMALNELNSTKDFRLGMYLYLE